MLSHDAIIYDAKAIKATLPDIKEGAEVGVTFLPLNHVAAQLFDIYLMLEAGACVYFADRFALKGSLVKTIKKARPTRFFGVPRVFEKIEEVILMSDGKVSSFSKYLIDSASEYMKYYYLSGMNE